jgi:methylmalonyl-CoA mutase N-terminal domain/subunit
MEPLMEAVRAYATLGEMADAMKRVFGEHKEAVRW